MNRNEGRLGMGRLPAVLGGVPLAVMEKHRRQVPFRETKYYCGIERVREGKLYFSCRFATHSWDEFVVISVQNTVNKNESMVNLLNNWQ
jgi:hypothetical protein